MSGGKLKDLMPKRSRYHDTLPKQLKKRLANVYHRLQEVPYIHKQRFEEWQDRFCYSPEADREIAIWEWLADEYEEQTVGLRDQGAKNTIFKKLLTESIDYEPLGVRKLPE